MARPFGRRVFLALGLAVLLALAGCAQLEDTTSPATSEPTASPAGTQTPTTPTVDPDNPFGERTVTVVIDRPADDPYKETVVRNALAYWENHSEEYAGYPLEFDVVESADEARIRIEFVAESITCEGHTEEFIVGCAPLNRETAATTSLVEIGRNYSASYTYDVVVHELGHTLGLDHDDAPQRYMAAKSPSGLQRETVDVYITGPSGEATPAQRAEVETALNYFETHPALVESERLDWRRVDSVDAADFVVEFKESDPDCFGTEGGSCPGTPKYADQQKLVLDGLDTEVTAWHVAFHLAPVFFEDDEIPASLSGEASRAEREQWPD